MKKKPFPKYIVYKKYDRKMFYPLDMMRIISCLKYKKKKKLPNNQKTMNFMYKNENEKITESANKRVEWNNQLHL
jgi:hypothetical protein